MLAKMHKTHGNHRNYLNSKSDMNASFGLNHFAGVVFYDTRGNKISFFFYIFVIDKSFLIKQVFWRKIVTHLVLTFYN